MNIFTKCMAVWFTCLLAISSSAQETKPAPAYTVQQVEGWTLHIHERLTREHPVETAIALTGLRAHLREIQRTVPAGAVASLQRIPLWFSPVYNDGRTPRAEYHPDAGWLKSNGRDPVMAKSVEFTNVLNWEAETRRMPCFVLHELAHGFHDRVLGNNHPGIRAAYERAKAGGRYESVRRWTGSKEVTDKAYALTNPQEYFAENTEAYFGRNDFQPFDRAELRAFDPEMFALLERLWSQF